MEETESPKGDALRAIGPSRQTLRRIAIGMAVASVVVLTVFIAARFMLRSAAEHGDVGYAHLLIHLTAEPSAINATNMYGYGPMQLAAQHGHADMLALLIEHGGNVNLRRPSSWNSPLIMAASRGHVDCCRLLLDKGAKAGEYGMFGGTRHTALQSAAGNGRLETVEFFLSRGIGPNEKEGSTSALHRACKENHLDVVKLLVAAGADLSSKQEWGHNTPLQFALKHGRTEIAEFLRQAQTAMR